jgi:uncharacterized protein (TIGR03067 family)
MKTNSIRMIAFLVVFCLFTSSRLHADDKRPQLGSDGTYDLARILEEIGYSKVELVGLLGHHCLTVKIAGHTASLVIDTATQRTMLHPKTAEKAKLSMPDKYERRIGIGGETKVRLATLSSYSLGKLAGVPVDVEVEDDPIIFDEKRGGLKADGLLGADILEYYSAVIDYSGPAVYFIEPWRKEKRLQGKWLAKSCVQSGQDVEGLTDTSIEFVQDQIVYRSGGQETKYRLVVGSLAQKPVKMNWATEDPKKTAAGIFKFDGEDLIICMQGNKVPDTPNKFPNKFESTKENEFVLFRFQRAKAEKR